MSDETRLLFAARHERILRDLNSDLHDKGMIVRLSPRSKARPTDPWCIYADSATLVLLKLRLAGTDVAPIGGWHEGLLPRSDVPETKPLDGAVW